MDPYEALANVHPSYIESLYSQYKKDPQSVAKEWRSFFSGFDFALSTEEGTPSLSDEDLFKELMVFSLIDGYRRKGHLLSDTNPIRKRKDRHPDLDLSNYQLSEEDLDRTFYSGRELGLGKSTLRQILAKLQSIYCRHLGFEFMYITSSDEREWLRQHIESSADQIHFPIEKKEHILQKLNESQVFEEFLSIKYVGQKRFSLEGGESTIPALDAIINKGAELDIDEFVIGMAHRGRLNVLVNILGKTYEQVFNEFEGDAIPDLTMGDGDVKYHLGYSSEIETLKGKTVNVKVAPNPSHLEAVSPVVVGYTRSKGDILYEGRRDRVMPIVIHGDAALSGQGVVYELIQMAQLKGYYVGGTIHFVINNQIGFTTDFDDARSSNYTTSVAATTEVPVIHVNGDDVEAVVYAVELAVAFRQKFKRDFFVDMVCYRKHGHNEGDDPKFTQPKLYELIGKHPSPREIYLKKLINEGDIERSLVEQMNAEYKKLMNKALALVKEHPLPYHYQEPELLWKKLRKSRPEDFEESPDTSIDEETMMDLIQRIISIPEGFHPLRKIEKMLKKRREQFFKTKLMDWASAELLTYATLLHEGHDVRLSGQDSLRGTFSHRHAVLFDEESNVPYNRLDHLFENQKARFRIYNSPLSEYGVLGFEYGYSLGSPAVLTIWEAQFGDFANGAQVVIDQFITSAESKWQRMSGITLLLPHGYEGQGPEHSSARLERFLQMCAEFNMSVVNMTTPANLFHVMRRQLAWPFRKPLVIMSPKSLLRHPKCVSPVEDFTQGKFRELIVDDWSEGKTDKVKKVVCCSGKLYYDILARQEKEKSKDLVIVRLEQLYPLPYKQLDEVMNRYPNAVKMWAQEEPANMGAWVYMLSCYRGINWELASRKSSASPATGYHKIHEEEQKEILDKIFE